MAAFPWLNLYTWTGLDINGLDHLQVWMVRCRERPAVARGMAVPKTTDPSQLSEDEITEAKQSARSLLT